MNFADISVKESLSTVTAVIRLATCAERRTGGCPEIEPSRDETRRDDTGEEQAPGTVPGAVVRRGYDTNSIRSRQRLPLLLRVGSFRLAMWFY
jgi:hypothetical protein